MLFVLLYHIGGEQWHRCWGTEKDTYFLTTILCLLPESGFVGYIRKILRTYNSLKAVSILKM
jgi:hypothetical protein